MTVGGTETPSDFSGLLLSYTRIPNLRSDIPVPRNSCPYSSRTLDLRRDSEGRTGFELMTVEIACREYELEPPVLTAPQLLDRDQKAKGAAVAERLEPAA